MTRKKTQNMTEPTDLINSEEKISTEIEVASTEVKLELAKEIVPTIQSESLAKEEQLDSQTLDMLKRVRNQKLVSGGLDPFYIPDQDKDSRFAYFWASTDREASPSMSYLESIGWRAVTDYRTIPTGGYTNEGTPGKHILVRIQKIVHDELQKIQNELNERKKNAVVASEILARDGRSGMKTSTVRDNVNDFFKNI